MLYHFSRQAAVTREAGVATAPGEPLLPQPSWSAEADHPRVYGPRGLCYRSTHEIDRSSLLDGEGRSNERELRRNTASEAGKLVDGRPAPTMTVVRGRRYRASGRCRALTPDPPPAVAPPPA